LDGPNDQKRPNALRLQATPLVVFTKKYNFPFEFTSFENGISLKATLKKNKPMTVTAGTFSASKDFDEISLDQLMQLSGRH
jgi:hypothetical protein